VFLKSLKISSGERIIREVVFHKGLNLIVDDTPAGGSSATGNNVGKTTLLMLVDYCLGGSAKQIYTDPESRSEYKPVKDFLADAKVLITLILREDLEHKSREVIIERNFLSRKEKIQRIDGLDLNDSEFEEALTNILVPGHYGRKPTFRQIISHNIRYKELSLSNTLKTLDKFTRDDEYETLYLFLFGIEFTDGSERQRLLAEIRVEESFKARLEGGMTKSAYEAALALAEGEIAELERRRASFDVNGGLKDDLQRLSDVKRQINSLTADLSRLSIRRGLILEAERDLQVARSSADLKQIESIYRQAKANIGTLQKTFEELQEFHNNMVMEKIRYITRDLPRLESEIESRQTELVDLLATEARLGEQIARKEPLDALETIISELNEKFRVKGHYEKTVQQLDEVDTTLRELYQRLGDIDDSLFSEETERKIKAKVLEFNRFFSKVSQELYGEKYALTVDPKVNRKGRRVYEFSAINANLSSGKKQGEITCFDIAYTLYADSASIPCMHFLLTDKKELVHDNQLVRIASEVNRYEIQLITSILRDKLPRELDQEGYIVLRLSQNDKLFRIEHK